MAKRKPGVSLAKANDEIPTDFILPTPENLMPPVAEIFNSQATLMVGKLTQQDTPSLQQWATSIWLVQQALVDVEKRGVMIKNYTAAGKHNGYKPNEAIQVVHKFQTQAMALAQQLGMTRKVRKVVGLPDQEDAGGLSQNELDRMEFDG